MVMERTATNPTATSLQPEQLCQQTTGKYEQGFGANQRTRRHGISLEWAIALPRIQVRRRTTTAGSGKVPESC